MRTRRPQVRPKSCVWSLQGVCVLDGGRAPLADGREPKSLGDPPRTIITCHVCHVKDASRARFPQVPPKHIREHTLAHDPNTDTHNTDMGKRQRMYMSPGLWSVLDADPSQGFALMDTRAATAAQQRMQQLQQLQAQQPRAVQQQPQMQEQAVMLAMQGGPPAMAMPQQQQPQPLRDQAAMAAPLAWTTPAAALGASTAMDDDSPSRFFYISSTEPQPAAAAAAAARAASAASAASASAAMPKQPLPQQQPPQQQPKPRAVTTDDMVASTYRPVLMTGTTPNSTSSIFCRNTVCNPDADQIILWCVLVGSHWRGWYRWSSMDSMDRLTFSIYLPSRTTRPATA